MKNYYLILLFIICLIFFLPFFLKPDLLAIKNNDLGRQYVPLFTFLKDSIFNYKQIPVWRPDQMMGESFIGNPHSSLLYPANLFFLIFPVKLASVAYLFSHFLLAGVFTYYLSRSFKLSPLPSFAAAIFYSFSTKMLLHLSAGHITMIAAFSFFPLAVLSVRKILTIGVRPLLGVEPLNWIIIGSASLTFIYFTYPTIFYYTVIFIVVYWIYDLLINLWQEKNLDLRKIRNGFFYIWIIRYITFSSV